MFRKAKCVIKHIFKIWFLIKYGVLLHRFSKIKYDDETETIFDFEFAPFLHCADFGADYLSP